MIGKTEQSTGDNSAAYQSQGSMTINNGMDYKNVSQLCLDLIHQNFPKLKEEAMAQAMTNVAEFTEQLRAEIEMLKGNISEKKLSEPDTQSALNDAVIGAAMKGNKSDLNLLVKLVGARLNSQNTDLLDITIEQAIKIVPKLTIAQLNFLAVKHFVGHIRVRPQDNDQILPSLEKMAQKVFEEFSANSIISLGNIQYLSGIGVIEYTPMFSRGIWGQLLEEYKQQFNLEMTVFKEKVVEYAPSFYALIELYVANNFESVELNSFGKVIALTHLGKVIGDLDLKIWIN